MLILITQAHAEVARRVGKRDGADAVHTMVLYVHQFVQELADKLKVTLDQTPLSQPDFGSGSTGTSNLSPANATGQPSATMTTDKSPAGATPKPSGNVPTTHLS